MLKAPGFTKRAADHIARLISREDLSAREQLPCVRWETSWLVVGTCKMDNVPHRFKVDCHGVRLAYDLPDHVMASLDASVLDFDGRQFVFVDLRDTRRLTPRQRRHPSAYEKHGLRAAMIRLFLRQYARRAQKRTEPNDRQYDRQVEQIIRRMKPDDLDRLMRDED
jgi:hypothetical protein